MAWRDEAMFDLELLAPVEDVVPAGLLLLALAGESISELAAVIGEQFAKLDRTGSFYFGQKIDTAALGLIAIDLDINPKGRPVDGDKQIASRSFIGHLRQVLDIDVQKASS